MGATKISFDPYAVLELKKGCTEKDIKDAYRLQCLKWHPDKNPNNKEEAEKRFIAAKEAFNFLFDKSLREEYDKKEEAVRVRNEQKRERDSKLDDKRRQRIEALNRREKEFAERSEPQHKTVHRHTAHEEKSIRAEMERIRKQMEEEAAAEVRKQQERVRLFREQHASTSTQEPEKDDEHPTLLVQWKSAEAGGVDYDISDIQTMFSPYGIIQIVTPIRNKKGSCKCLVEFERSVELWGAELETGPAHVISASWKIKPSEARKTAPANDSGPSTAEEDLHKMSNAELEKLLMAGIGDLEPPPEKRTKWFDEE